MPKKSDRQADPDRIAAAENQTELLREKTQCSGIGCVIAAAGMSSRMGAFKPLLPLGQETILRTGILTMKKAGVLPVVVVTGREHEAVEESIADLEAECVFNPDYEHCQMFDSVKRGLERVYGRCRKVFFAPADAPLYSEKTLEALLNSGNAVCAPYQDGKFGHPVCFDADLIPEILCYEGDGGLSGALEFLGGKTPVYCRDPGAFIDADTAEDYEVMKRIYQETRGKRCVRSV